MLDFVNMIVPVLLLTASTLLGCLEYAHMLQLESYQLDGYARWIAANKNRAYAKGLVVSIVSLAAMMVLSFFAGHWTYLAASAVALAGGAISFALCKRRPAKKKLVLTKRVQRLLAIHCALWAILYMLVDVAGDYLVQLRALPFAVPAIWVWALALSARLAQPLETAINRRYFRDAQRRLRENPNLIKIGITGSYGKTSTKFILGTLLKEKYNTLVTPSSFNTPMGVTRVVREQLKPEHEVFIAEMGARHKGDIAELVDLVHPTIGILTSVGPQHLETFGSIETVAATKYELIEGLPADGAAFFAADGGWCETLYAKTAVPSTLAGLAEKCPVRAENLRVSNEGSAFTLVTPEGEIDCATPLLGRHNIQNAVLCAAVALHLGLTPQQIQSGMSKLQPVEHRLQLIRGAGGVTVIDDAFNANPAGAKAAMEVLAGFPGRRICVTPGMVELGEEEEELNRLFGRQMAAACTIAILVGKRRAKPIAEGLREAGFAEENLHIVANLDEATALLARTTQPGDVVLFENDLPDNYDE
jgi:UDP-N-acetylmuramoyl-tripeptide--D-alanyl-D-alanine ligase